MKFRILGFIFITIITLWLIFSGFSKSRKKTDFSCSDCNIVMAVIDDLRYDRIFSLGYSRKITPCIDSFINSGVTFTNAISASSWTLPSVMSIFTGVYPYKHKVTNKYALISPGKEEFSNLRKLSPNLYTITEILQENGYKTGGFTGGSALNRQFGFGLGFDEYVDNRDFAPLSYSYPKALEWINKNRSEKLFIFLHGYDIHGQYIPEDGFDKRYVDPNYKGKLTGSKEEQKTLRDSQIFRGSLSLSMQDRKFISDIYDEKIEKADGNFCGFIDEYRKMGLYDKTIFIIMSDHGEELYDHGMIDHGHSLYQELIHVPLIIKIPNIQIKKNISDLARTIDIYPTVLAILNIKLKPSLSDQLEGVSLLPLIQDKKINLQAYSETSYRFAAFKRSLIEAKGWKIIEDTEKQIYEYYNLKSDPDEMKDLSSINDTKFEELRNKLNSYKKY